MKLWVDQIRDNLYVVRGGGRFIEVGGVTLPTAATSLAYVGSDGVVLVDTKLPGWGQPLLDLVATLTDKPVTTIINTHTHIDHVGGNVECPPGIDIIAHEHTARLMREMRPVSGGPVQPNPFKEHGGRGLPTRTFRDRLTIGSGRDRVELYHFGRAHTSGDAWVVFPELGVMHSGDAFAGKAVPPLDVNNGASGVEYPATIARAIAELHDIDTIVTGHYQTALTMKDLETYGEFTALFIDEVRAAKSAGQSVDEFVSGWAPPDRFMADGYMDFSHLRSIKADVEVIWAETE